MTFWIKYFKKIAYFGLILLILCMLSGTAAAINAPVVSRTESTENTIELEWKPVAGAESYMIRRALDVNGPYDPLKTVPSGIGITNYKDTGLTPGTTYHYKIRVSGNGETSDSAIISVTTKTLLPPTPTKVVARSLITNEV